MTQPELLHAAHTERLAKLASVDHQAGVVTVAAVVALVGGAAALVAVPRPWSLVPGLFLLSGGLGALLLSLIVHVLENPTLEQTGDLARHLDALEQAHLRKRRLVRAAGLILVLGLLTGVVVFCVFAIPRAVEPEGVPRFEKFKRLDDVYEPSGVCQLPDGRLLIVEDESQRPLTLLTPSGSGRFTARALDTNVTLEDLEGLAIDTRGRAFAITSHSPKNDGERADTRERLVRFRVEGDEVRDLEVVGDLRARLLAAHPDLEDGLNVEGLTFDPARERLLIGLRAPVLDGKAVLVVLANPHAVFEEQEADVTRRHLLDLDGGGIRGMTWDSRLKGYLIVSRDEEADGKAGRFKLWLWEGDDHSPRRVKLPGVKKGLRHAEGICPVSYQGHERLLVVSDDGDPKDDKGAHYALLDYEQLEIEPR